MNNQHEGGATDSVELTIPEIATPSASNTFATLYARDEYFVYNLAARIVCDATSAEYIALQVFLVAYQQIHGADFVLPANTTNWLSQQVLAATLNWSNNQRPDGRPELVTWADEQDRVEPGQIQVIGRGWRALCHLSMGQRAVLALHEWQKLNYTTISTLMQLSKDRVAALLYEARLAFRNAYAAEGAVPEDVEATATDNSDCESYGPAISASLDGELNGGAASQDQSQLESLLRSDAACQKLESELKRGIYLYSLLPPRFVPTTLGDQVRMQVATLPDGEVLPGPIPPPPMTNISQAEPGWEAEKPVSRDLDDAELIVAPEQPLVRSAIVDPNPRQVNVDEIIRPISRTDFRDKQNPWRILLNITPVGLLLIAGLGVLVVGVIFAVNMGGSFLKANYPSSIAENQAMTPAGTATAVRVVGSTPTTVQVATQAAAALSLPAATATNIPASPTLQPSPSATATAVPPTPTPTIAVTPTPVTAPAVVLPQKGTVVFGPSMNNAERASQATILGVQQSDTILTVSDNDVIAALGKEYGTVDVTALGTIRLSGLPNGSGITVKTSRTTKYGAPTFATILVLWGVNDARLAVSAPTAVTYEGRSGVGALILAWRAMTGKAEEHNSAIATLQITDALIAAGVERDTAESLLLQLAIASRLQQGKLSDATQRASWANTYVTQLLTGAGVHVPAAMQQQMAGLANTVASGLPYPGPKNWKIDQATFSDVRLLPQP